MGIMFSQDRAYHRAVGTPHLHEGVNLFAQLSILQRQRAGWSYIVHAGCNLFMFRRDRGAIMSRKRPGKIPGLPIEQILPTTSPFKDESLSIGHTLPDNCRTTVGRRSRPSCMMLLWLSLFQIEIVVTPTIDSLAQQQPYYSYRKGVGAVAKHRRNKERQIFHTSSRLC